MKRSRRTLLTTVFLLHFTCNLSKPPAKAVKGNCSTGFAFDRRFRIPWLEALRGGERRRC